MRRRLTVTLLVVLGAGLALAACDQKRSIYLDPGHDPDHAARGPTPAKSSPPAKPPAPAGHQS